MNKFGLTLACLSVVALAGCNNSLTPLSAEGVDSSNGSSSIGIVQPSQPESNSAKMIAELESALRHDLGSTVISSGTGSQKLSLGSFLNEQQIQTIIAIAQANLTSKGLASSDDLEQIIPALIQGASLGVGALQLPDSSKISTLLSLIGNSTLSSLVNLSEDEVSTSLLETISKSLFANLNLAGVKTETASSVSNSVIGSLIHHLSGTDLATSGLSTVIQVLAKGAILGISKTSLPGILASTVFSKILKSIGEGSQMGITSLISKLGLGSSSPFIKSLIDSFTTGSNSALSQIVNSGTSSSPLKTLLASVLSGLGQNSTGSTGGTVKSIVVSLVGSLLSNLLK